MCVDAKISRPRVAALPYCVLSVVREMQVSSGVEMVGRLGKAGGDSVEDWYNAVAPRVNVEVLHDLGQSVEQDVSHQLKKRRQCGQETGFAMVTGAVRRRTLRNGFIRRKQADNG